MGERTCSVDGCTTPAKCRGWCHKHHTRWLRNGSTERLPRTSSATCSVTGCGGRVIARGWCGTHYARWRKHGDANATVRERRSYSDSQTCDVVGCDRGAEVRGWCRKHYQRWTAYGDPNHPVRTRRTYHPDAVCATDGCTARPANADMCPTHHFADWVSRNPDKAREQWNRKRLRKIGATTTPVTTGGIAQRIAYYGGMCWMCGIAEYEHLDHVKPLANGGPHMLSNLRPACATCNLTKNAQWPFIPNPRTRSPHRRTLST